MPKRGFRNIFKSDYVVINTGRLEQAVEAGKLEKGATITGDILRELGILSRLGDGVRLLAKGEIKTALKIEVAGASEAAVKAVEAAGGTVTILGGPTPEPAAT